MVIRNLGPLLHKSGYTPDKLNLMIWDDNIRHHLSKRSIQEWVDNILEDKDGEKYVQGISYHWYGNTRNGKHPADILHQIHNKHPRTFLLASEACHLEGVGNGRWDFGEHYAHDIIRVESFFH